MTDVPNEPRWEDQPKSLEVSGGMLRVSLSDGRVIATPLEWYPRLVEATPDQLANVELSIAGIHWPDLDEDINVEGLLVGKRSAETDVSLKKWLQQRRP